MRLIDLQLRAQFIRTWVELKKKKNRKCKKEKGEREDEWERERDDCKYTKTTMARFIYIYIYITAIVREQNPFRSLILTSFLLLLLLLLHRTTAGVYTCTDREESDLKDLYRTRIGFSKHSSSAKLGNRFTATGADDATERSFDPRCGHRLAEVLDRNRLGFRE